jgi:hypothetical protein
MIDAEKIRSTLNKKFDIALAGGQDHLKGKIFRIGHLGFASERDILTVIAAIEATLIELGVEGVTPGAGVAAAPCDGAGLILGLLFPLLPEEIFPKYLYLLSRVCYNPAKIIVKSCGCYVMSNKNLCLYLF